MKKTIETIGMMMTLFTLVWATAYAIGVDIFNISTKDFEIDLSDIGDDLEI